MRVTFDFSTGHLTQECHAHVTVLLAWPAMKAYRRAARGRAWFACQPTFRLPPELDRGDPAGADHRTHPRALRPDVNYQGLDEIRQYCSIIPFELRQVVSQFPERHWDILTWLGRTGFAAEELLESNPAVAFAVACGAEFCTHDTPVSYRQKHFLLAYHTQRHILIRLGFPPTERVRRVLRKVPARLVTVAQLTLLRQGLVDEAVAERLSHLPRVNAAVLQLVADGTLVRLSPAALADLARPDDEEGALDLAQQLAEVVRLWGLVRPGAEPPREFAGPAQVRAARAAVAEESIAAAMDRRCAFPPPPVPGTELIVPITTRRMLIEEGRLQHNCVADYEDKIVRGELSIYRVLSPQRCTLSLCRGSGRRRGRWVISELKAACNGRVSGATRQSVLAWLDPATTHLPARRTRSVAAEPRECPLFGA